MVCPRGGCSRHEPPEWLRRSPITVLQGIHTALKGQQAPRGNKQRSITNSLQKLTASICACGRGLSRQVKCVIPLCIILPSGSQALARPHLLGAER